MNADHHPRMLKIAAILNKVAPDLKLRLVANRAQHTMVTTLVTFGVETLVTYNPQAIECLDDTALVKAVLLTIEHARIRAELKVWSPWVPATRGVS